MAVCDPLAAVTTRVAVVGDATGVGEGGVTLEPEPPPHTTTPATTTIAIIATRTPAPFQRGSCRAAQLSWSGFLRLFFFETFVLTSKNSFAVQ